MNRFFIIIAILLTSAKLSFGQAMEIEYTPFPTQNSIWRTLEIRGDNYAPNVFGTTEKTRTFFMQGDTMINELIYHKIYTTQAKVIPEVPDFEQYHGAFKEVNKMIYYIYGDSENETILYDFNLSVGDNITTIADDIGVRSNIYVGSIDTVILQNNEARRRYNLMLVDIDSLDTMPTPTPRGAWIEGVGDVTKGLFSFPFGVSVFTGVNKFQCFSEGENLIYQNPSLDNCFTDTASYTIEYTPLVVENATWILFSGYNDFTIIDYWAYKIEGDTTINNIDYKKLYYYEIEKTGTAKFQIVNRRIGGYLREDLSARKVYGRNLITLQDVNGVNDCFVEGEGLMFDFNKKLGDNFEDCHSTLGFEEDDYKIAKDTILEIFGQHRRVFKNKGFIELIEGVGYNDGLFLVPTDFVAAGYGYGLVDYCIGTNFSCNLLTNTETPIAQKITIFPNPTTDFIQIQLSQPLKATVQLKTVAGQILSETAFNGLTHEIMVRDMPKGVYYLHLQAEEGYLVRKVIVQ